MPKGSLFHLLKSGQDLPWPIRYQIALDVSYGLRDLHARAILHRDLMGRGMNIETDKGYTIYRTQIKQGIDSASRPTMGKIC